MKRVACLVAVLSASAMLVGCDKPPEKLELKNVHVEISGAPNVKIDGTGGVGIPQIDLRFSPDDKNKNVWIDEYNSIKNAIANAQVNNSGGGDSNNAQVAETKPTDPGEAGLVGIWKAVKLDPQPADANQAADLMKKGVEFKGDHSYHVLESGKPAGEDSAGTWKIVEGNIEMTGQTPFEFKIDGKQLTMKAGGTSVIMEK